MRNLNELGNYRRTSKAVMELYGSFGNELYGVFDVPFPQTGQTLLCIASVGEGWEHVSVSLKHRTPNWGEMEHVKRTFFLPNETAMQLHVPEEEHISFADTCLHLWRPLEEEIPRPPGELVGALKRGETP